MYRPALILAGFSTLLPEPYFTQVINWSIRAQARLLTGQTSDSMAPSHTGVSYLSEGREALV